MGRIYVNFADLRDTTKAYVKIRSVRATWDIQYLAAKHFASKLRPERFMHTLMCEGQVIVRADFSGPRQRFDSGTIGHLIKELLENYGEVMAYESGIAELPMVAFRAEYYDAVAAEKAVAALDGFRIGVSCFLLPAGDPWLIEQGCILSIIYYQPHLPSSLAQLGGGNAALLPGRKDRNLDKASEHMGLGDCQKTNEIQSSTLFRGPPSARPNPNVRSSISPRNVSSHPISPPRGYYAHDHSCHDSRQDSYGASYYDNYPCYGVPLPPLLAYGPGAIGQERDLAPSPHYRTGPYLQQHRGPARVVGRQNNEYTSGHHNVVDVERIRRGLDVRTTVIYHTSALLLGY